jgi:hypothetical protein
MSREPEDVMAMLRARAVVTSWLICGTANAGAATRQPRNSAVTSAMGEPSEFRSKLYARNIAFCGTGSSAFFIFVQNHVPRKSRLAPIGNIRGAVFQ